MRALVAAVLILAPIAAFAQPAVQPLVPFTVSPGDAQALQSYLNEQPMKFSLPIAQWMDRLEKAAQAEQAAKAAEAKKIAPSRIPPPPTPKH